MYMFTFLCFSATISMIGYWTNEYFKDNDLSFVDYKYTKDAKQPFPTFSLCFKNPFFEESLQKHDPSLNSSIYQQYLKGVFQGTEVYKNIHYDNVTLDLKQYIMNVGIFYRNNSNKFLDKTNYETYLSIYVSYNGFCERIFPQMFCS